ncbi:uncharacterized protein LOC131294201 [Anopheles ziemanni]|nr:uncharacterized protein LOC131294201 [Anopheles ziemanni]
MYSTSNRLDIFLRHYNQLIDSGKNYKTEMRNFVHAKLNEFSIPVVGLQDDASQLEKVFLHVADRKDFYEKLLAQQTEEYKDLQEEKVNLEKAIIEKERNINASKGYIKDMEGKINQEQQKKQQLEATINGNPPAIQG